MSNDKKLLGSDLLKDMHGEVKMNDGKTLLASDLLRDDKISDKLMITAINFNILRIFEDMAKYNAKNKDYSCAHEALADLLPTKEDIDAAVAKSIADRKSKD